MNLADKEQVSSFGIGLQEFAHVSPLCVVDYRLCWRYCEQKRRIVDSLDARQSEEYTRVSSRGGTRKIASSRSLLFRRLFHRPAWSAIHLEYTPAGRVSSRRAPDHEENAGWKLPLAIVAGTSAGSMRLRSSPIALYREYERKLASLIPSKRSEGFGTVRPTGGKDREAFPTLEKQSLPK